MYANEEGRKTLNFDILVNEGKCCNGVKSADFCNFTCWLRPGKVVVLCSCLVAQPREICGIEFVYVEPDFVQNLYNFYWLC